MSERSTYLQIRNVTKHFGKAVALAADVLDSDLRCRAGLARRSRKRPSAAGGWSHDGDFLRDIKVDERR